MSKLQQSKKREERSVVSAVESARPWLFSNGRNALSLARHLPVLFISSFLSQRITKIESCAHSGGRGLKAPAKRSNEKVRRLLNERRRLRRRRSQLTRSPSPMHALSSVFRSLSLSLPRRKPHPLSANNGFSINLPPCTRWRSRCRRPAPGAAPSSPRRSRARAGDRTGRASRARAPRAPRSRRPRGSLARSRRGPRRP